MTKVPTKRTWFVLTIATTLLLIVLVACGGNAPQATDPVVAPVATDTPATDSTATPLPEPTQEPAADAAATAEAEAEPAATDTPQPEPTEEPAPTAGPTLENTPGAVEETGSEPPSKIDAIIASFSEPPQTNGDVVILYGQVLDVNGTPLEGVAVEIWQTDASGVYDHPGDPSTAGRDTSFQFFGTSVSDADGFYAFRTIRPGHYEPRPSHYHVKVSVDGDAVLVTQFYFGEERDDLADEGPFAQAGELGDMLILLIDEGLSANGSPVRLANNDLVIDTGIGDGTLSLTPAQGEGPYYPVVTVADYDNDLTRLP